MKKTMMIFFVILIPISFLTAGGVPEAAPSYTEGEITYLEGDVTLEGNPAEFGMIVRTGETVNTGAGSYCDIVFGDKNVFRVHENTLAIINFSNAEIDLQAGSLSAVFNKLTGEGAGDGDAFKIRTPHTVAGVRGTVFYLKVEDEDSTYVCTCNGKIQYQDNIGRNERETELYHHGALRYKLEDGETTVEEGTLIYHSDESMEDVADRISVDIPWGEKTY